MIAFLIAAILAVTVLATAISLTDSVIRARSAFTSLKRERSLAAIGYVPQVDAAIVRLRRPTLDRRETSRSFVQRAPRLLDAA